MTIYCHYRNQLLTLISEWIPPNPRQSWRRIDLLISTRSGKTSLIAIQLLEREEVIYVGKSIGEHTIHLRAEIIVKDNTELLDVLEDVKATDDLRDTLWS